MILEVQEQNIRHRLAGSDVLNKAQVHSREIILCKNKLFRRNLGCQRVGSTRLVYLSLSLLMPTAPKLLSVLSRLPGKASNSTLASLSVCDGFIVDLDTHSRLSLYLESVPGQERYKITPASLTASNPSCRCQQSSSPSAAFVFPMVSVFSPCLATRTSSSSAVS